MTTPDNNDKELENYLQGGSMLSRLYRQSTTSGPAPGTNNAILSAARKAVSKPSRPVSPFGYRWMIPASLAAVLVLTVSIVILQDSSIEDTSKLKQTEMDQARPAITEGLPASKSKLARKKEQTTAAPTQLAKKVQPALTLGDSADSSEPASAKSLAKQAGRLALTEEQPAPASAPPSPAAVTGKNAAELKVTAREAPAEQLQANAADGKKRDMRQEKTTPETEQQIQPERRLESAAPFTPEQWLKKIQELVQTNKLAEAEKEYNAFKLAFPDFQIDYKRYPELSKLADKKK